MDTKSLIINVATKLFQQKGYIGVGLNEILSACNLSKGSLYHHFPNGKEELLIACLIALNETIMKDIQQIFDRYPTTQEATKAMIDKLIVNFETEGTIAGYTVSSIVSEMASLSDPIRNACNQLYQKMGDIYCNKLMKDGYPEDTAKSISLMLTASIEGGMMLCLTQQATKPLQVISELLPNMLREFKQSE